MKLFNSPSKSRPFASEQSQDGAQDAMKSARNRVIYTLRVCNVKFWLTDGQRATVSTLKSNLPFTGMLVAINRCGKWPFCPLFRPFLISQIAASVDNYWNRWKWNSFALIMCWSLVWYVSWWDGRVNLRMASDLMNSERVLWLVGTINIDNRWSLLCALKAVSSV